MSSLTLFAFEENQLGPGSLVVIYGPRGSGKSTLARHLARSLTTNSREEVVEVRSEDIGRGVCALIQPTTKVCIFDDCYFGMEDLRRAYGPRLSPSITTIVVSPYLKSVPKWFRDEADYVFEFPTGERSNHRSCLEYVPEEIVDLRLQFAPFETFVVCRHAPKYFYYQAPQWPVADAWSVSPGPAPSSWGQWFRALCG
jgi:hypothetical protein